MVGIVVDGRMGNQMFEYAVVLSKSKKYRTSFFIHPLLWQFPFVLPKYFALPGYNKYINNLRVRLYNLVLKKSYDYVNLNAKPDDPEINNPLITAKSYLYGYFQSEQYFQEHKEDVIKAFQLNKESRLKFESKYKQLYDNNKILAVHLRRTDFVDVGSDLLGGKDISLTVDYYKRAFKMIEDIDDYKIIFVSDDIEYVKKTYGEKPNYYFERNDEITDFQLLLNADKLIIANSSFSWWAAYLNPKKDKTIFAPKYWHGFKVNKSVPKCILPDDWKKVEVL